MKKKNLKPLLWMIVPVAIVLLTFCIKVHAANYIVSTTLTGGNATNGSQGTTNVFTGYPGTNAVTNVMMANSTMCFNWKATNSTSSGVNFYTYGGNYDGVYVVANQNTEPGNRPTTLMFSCSQANGTNEDNEYVTLSFDAAFVDTATIQSNFFSWTVGPMTNNGVFTTNLNPNQQGFLYLYCNTIKNTNGANQQLTNLVLKALQQTRQ